jgi:2-polyprenyl-3-methyl-5-hydroxy-6-metoxy-1,4-benzoquinol methylase
VSRRQRLRSTGVSSELVQQLNTSWRLTGPEASASLKQKLVAPLRRILSRLLGTQETFNAMVVQYVNADQQRLDVLDEALDQLDDARRYQEALAARERRMDDAMRAMRTEHDEIRTALSVLRTRAAENPRSQIPNPKSETTNQRPQIAAHDMGASYVGFEDQFRGSSDTIAANLASYVPIFSGARDVLDIGCGRGEFLTLLRDNGIGARGIDLNASMVQVCRDHGLQAETADALSFLLAQPDASLGGLFAAQVVEHLEPGYLTQLLDAAAAKLRPGAPIVLETINPACWFAFFESYVRDITHVRPLHPDTLRFLLVASGFQRVDVQFRAPYPEHEKLRPVHGLPADAAETINGNTSKLNSLLFTHLDYAAIAYRS